MRIAAYVLTTIIALFLTFDTVLKVLRLGPAVKATTDHPVWPGSAAIDQT